MAKKKQRQYPKDKWRPFEWKQEERKVAIYQQVRIAKHHLDRFGWDMRNNSTNADVSYDDALAAVEKLYEMAELGKLAEDNKRRHEEVMQRVRKAEEARNRKG